MKVYVQYATDLPQGWEEMDSSQWKDTPIKLEPAGGEVINAEKGWIHCINVQGIVFDGYDHYVVKESIKGIYVIVWNDDLEDWKNDNHAQVWYLLDPVYDPQVKCINTRQSYKLYCESVKRKIHHSNIDILEETLPFTDFNKKQGINYIRHGIWVPDKLNTALIAMQHSHGWREWIK